MEPRDRWKKQLPGGETVQYKSDITPGRGGVITANKGSKVQTVTVNPWSRESHIPISDFSGVGYGWPFSTQVRIALTGT